jgi:hypothetical protein
MAKALKSATARFIGLLLPVAAWLALTAPAHGETSLPPGCVMRYDNGKPYVYCRKDSKRRGGTQAEKSVVRPYSAPLVRPSQAPTVGAPPPASAPMRPAIEAPAGGAPPASLGAAPTGPARNGHAPAAPERTAAPHRAPELRAVRALIEPAEMPPREVAGYGIVAFTTRPQPHDVERYKTICEAYKATLTSQAELPPNTPLSEQMITYWPIVDKNTPEARRADCPHLVANYALRLGLDAIQDADKKQEQLASRRGPFLIAWAPSESRFVPDALVLVFDLSAFDGEKSFTEVFQDWRQHITDKPELWRRGGFNVEAVRRIIRDTFDRYGDGLMRLIKS